MRREDCSIKDAVASLSSAAPLIPNAVSDELGWMGLQAFVTVIVSAMN